MTKTPDEICADLKAEYLDVKKYKSDDAGSYISKENVDRALRGIAKGKNLICEHPLLTAPYFLVGSIYDMLASRFTDTTKNSEAKDFYKIAYEHEPENLDYLLAYVLCFIGEFTRDNINDIQNSHKEFDEIMDLIAKGRKLIKKLKSHETDPVQ